MPSCANKNTKNNDTINSNINDKDKLIEELLKKVNNLTETIEGMKNETDNTNHVEFNEPIANKQIRVVSLCYGELNLSTEPFGAGKLFRFKKYGEVKNILYSTLVDIVNNNRSFAEEGLFYILDKDAVYFLGLTDAYDKILPQDIIDNIYTYDESVIPDILNRTTDEQREVIVNQAILKIYNGENVDLNKCMVIGKCCNVNIMSKVDELKKLEENRKASN